MVQLHHGLVQALRSLRQRGERASKSRNLNITRFCIIGGAIFILVLSNILGATYLAPSYNDKTLQHGDGNAIARQPSRRDVPVRHKTKTLVTTQLPGVKVNHYTNYLGPSWRRLVQDRRNSDTKLEAVLPDLFIACAGEACNQIDHECRRLNITSNATSDQNNNLRQMLLNRQEDEMLCYFANVPEKENENYVFLHSLHYLEMEPFLSILDLDYYDYVLRTDADALVFPGLLHLSPEKADGWIGSGYYGEEITHYLVRYASDKFLPSLGEPLRPVTATPSMQSTFYVSCKKFSKFVRTLILASSGLYYNAFDKKHVCPELTKLEITQQILSKKYDVVEDICKWPFWMRGVSSLYGTRIAADYVLENVTVTGALDSLATVENSKDQPTNKVIQVHLLNTKKVLDRYAPDINICISPRESIQLVRSKIAEENPSLAPWSDVILNAAENITFQPEVPATVHHQTAEVFLNLFRKQHGCDTWPSHDRSDPQTRANGDKEMATECHTTILKEIKWAKEKASAFRGELDTKNKLEDEYKVLAQHPVVINALGRWCATCKWAGKLKCSQRLEYVMKEGPTKISKYLAHLQVMSKGVCEFVQLEDRSDEGKELVNEWCGDCIWHEKVTCDERHDYFAGQYLMDPLLARLQIIKSDQQCRKK